MARSSAEERIQVGLDATPGAGGSAGKQLNLDRWTLQPVEPKAQHTSAGSELPSGESRARGHSTGDFEGPLCVNTLPYLAAAHFNKQTGSPYTFAPNPYGADELQTLALQVGSDEHAEAAEYGVVDSLRLRWTKDDPSLTGTSFSQTLDLDATMTSTPTIVPKDPADGGLWYAQVGATIGGLSTIPAEECELSSGPRWGPHNQNDEEAFTFTEHVKLKHTPTMVLTVQSLDDADDLWEASRLKQGRFLRVVTPFITEISPGVHPSIICTIYGTVEAPQRADADNVQTSAFTFHPEPHADLGGSWINLVVTNGRSL